MTTDRDALLMAEAELGIDAQKFFNTDLGRYFIGRIEAEISSAKDAFADVDLEDRNAVWGLQEQIKRASLVKQWIAEVIMNGQNAEKILTHEARDD